MSRKRGGDRAERINYCRMCKQGMKDRDKGQMLRFIYLCESCTAAGYRLVPYIDSPIPPRRWYVRIMRGGHYIK